MPLSLQIALGVFLALLAMRLVDHLLVLHRDARRARMVKDQLEEAATSFIDEMHKEMEAERAAEAAKPKRRTAAKKTVTKKGVSNAKATTKRSSAARRS